MLYNTLLEPQAHYKNDPHPSHPYRYAWMKKHYALKCLNIDQHLLLTKQTRQKLQQSA